MDKNKEANKKLTANVKKVRISQAVLQNNHSHLAIKTTTPRKISYISRAKNVALPFDKKYNMYTAEAKSFLKPPCDKCRIGTSSHLLVNAASVKPPTQLTKIEPGHDMNCNLSFNPHAAFCNFPTLTEMPSFSVSYQTTGQHYELAVQNSIKHKPRTGYRDKRPFHSKISNSKVPMQSNKFFSPVPHSSISYQNSKSAPATLPNTVPFITVSTNRICSDAIVTEKFNPKCFLKPNELVGDQFTGDIKVANFPVFPTPNLPNKACFTLQVDPENQFRGLKKSDYFIHKWQQISVSSLFENPTDLKDGDKMRFPVLPSNVQKEQIKSNYNCAGNRSPSELSYEDHSDLGSANSVSEVITTTVSLGTNTTPIIPQASYADVIRMSSICSSSSSSNSIVDSKKMSESEQNVAVHTEMKDENSQSGKSDWVISKLSQLDLKPQDPRNIAFAHYNPNVPNSVKPQPIVVSLEKPSFYNSSVQNSKSVIPLSPSERIKGDDSFNGLHSYEENADKMSSCSSAYSSIPSDHIANTFDGQAASSKTDSMYSSASSVNSSYNAFKPVEKKSINKKNIFPVMMNNCSPPDEASEITFGIEYDEIVKLCFDNCDDTKNASGINQIDGKSSYLEKAKVDNSLKPEVQALPVESLSEPKIDKDIIQNKLLVNGKNIYWKDSDVNYNQNNHMKLTSYFASLWKDHETG